MKKTWLILGTNWVVKYSPFCTRYYFSFKEDYIRKNQRGGETAYTCYIQKKKKTEQDILTKRGTKNHISTLPKLNSPKIYLPASKRGLLSTYKSDDWIPESPHPRNISQYCEKCFDIYMNQFLSLLPQIQCTDLAH